MMAIVQGQILNIEMNHLLLLIQTHKYFRAKICGVFWVKHLKFVSAREKVRMNV